MLNEDAVTSVLSLLKAEFAELAGIRDRSTKPGNRKTKIFVNCYDFPFVTGKPAPFGYGPWLKPSLDYAYKQMSVPPDMTRESLVVRGLLKRFRAMLVDVSAEVDDFIVVETQGTLRKESLWQNEIHPSPAGFGCIADKFQTALEASFSA